MGILIHELVFLSLRFEQLKRIVQTIAFINVVQIKPHLISYHHLQKKTLQKKMKQVLVQMNAMAMFCIFYFGVIRLK